MQKLPIGISDNNAGKYKYLLAIFLFICYIGYAKQIYTLNKEHGVFNCIKTVSIRTIEFGKNANSVYVCIGLSRAT